jgi:hypothetical protein
MDDYSNNSVIKELINNTPSIIIHEHDFVPIALKEKKR